ncbi:MAG TPA: MiaB/RimO family radical SAM methylthiotransferase, partial [Proteobacteria bacterium]|nr:MiaB/RimO family radical SAM methylthiotransferase [Pseudomonadota bacterium]
MRLPKTFKIIELGCPKSEVDSSHLAAVLEDRGLVRIWDEGGHADITIVNTCAFLQETKNTSLRTLRALKAEGDSLVVAFGCLVEGYRREAREAADVIIGLTEIGAAYEAIESFVAKGRLQRKAGALPDPAPRSLEHRSYHYLKIAEGCSNFCRYCRIPQFRGRFRSRPLKNILDEAGSLFDAGTREIVLVAQDVARWGEDIYGRPRLEYLLERLARIADGRWIPLLYLHPARVTKELVALVAQEPSICSYLDIPIQHVSDAVLARMGRPHGTKNPRFIVDWIRENHPDVAIRTTVMVGYPSETDRDFDELYSFCRSVEFDHLGAFAFSPEPKTPARRMKGQVPEDVKADRLARI